MENVFNIDRDLLYSSKYVTFVTVDKGTSYVEYSNSLDEQPAAHLDCYDTNSADRRKYNAVWLWDFKKALQNPEQTINKLSKIGIGMIFIQVNKELEQFVKFLEVAEKNNIKVSALAGEPSSIYDDSLNILLNDLLVFNKKHTYKFAGFQVDVEPYTLKDYKVNKSGIFKKYNNLISSLYNQKNGLEFSVVVPFWLSSETLDDGENELNYVLDNSDFVSIMSYRTNYRNVLSIANNSLCLAAKKDKNIHLGLEMLPLPNEKHITIYSEYILNNFNTDIVSYDEIIRLQAVKKFEVKGSDISFENNLDAILPLLEKKPPYLSFRGWSINGIENYLFN